MTTLLTVKQTAQHLLIGTTLCRELIARGEIPSVRIGRLIRVRAEALDEYIMRSEWRLDNPVRETQPKVRRRWRRLNSSVYSPDEFL